MGSRTGKTPVTVLTGFLGAGKTTLLNRILGERHGKRIAVIENEYGEIGIDQALVIDAEEEVFEMSNGCICCTVRGDLIRILGNLTRRKDRFDYVLVETTGLADPGPVVQTFFVDDEVRDEYVLDGIVTVVDARHLEQQQGRNREVDEQIAFADVVLINKTDLVDITTIERIEQQVRGMNGLARIHRTQRAEFPVDRLLDIRAFDLDAALAQRPDFLTPEYPFESALVYELPVGLCSIRIQPGPEPTIGVVLLANPASVSDIGETDVERAVRGFAKDAITLLPGATWPSDCAHARLVADAAGTARYFIEVAVAGPQVVFTQHLPEEFELEVLAPDGASLAPLAQREWAAAHEHDASISSFAIECAGDLDGDLFNAWLGRLLAEHGVDLFRLKGFISISGQPARYVLQGVHMLVDCEPGTPWGREDRVNQLVFIGRNLPRTKLESEFRACLI